MNDPLSPVPPDVNVLLGDHRFTFRVAAIIRRGDRVLTCSLPGSRFHFLPGGRVRAGETSREALERELREELAIRAEIGALAMTVENLFPESASRVHEVGLYYEVSLADGVDPCLRPDPENGATFQWVRVGELARVDLRPRFLCDALREAGAGHVHFVNRE